ncbi:cytochrome c oxidase assembly protein [Actinomycetospora sp. C-140]
MGWPGWGALLTTWQPSWAVDAVVLVAAVAYGAGVRRAGRAEIPWPRGRTVAFAAALVGLVLTFDSGIAVGSHASFGVHMVMHLMLIMVVPALWVAGGPAELLRLAGPPRGRAAVESFNASRVGRGMFHPATVLVVYGLVVALTHLTGFMQAMADSMALHHLEQALYLGAGLLFFATALGADATPSRPSFLGRFALMMLAMGVDTLVGLVLLLSPRSPFPAYELTDVRVGGALMWAGGDALMMLVIVVLARWWVRSSGRGPELGPWLESVRRDALGLGTGPGPGRGEPEDGVDDDEESLAAYNRMLARLHDRER